MADPSNGQELDLALILKTLASLPQVHQTAEPLPPGQAYAPHDPNQLSLQNDAKSHHQSQRDPRLAVGPVQPTPPSPRPSLPTTDPTTITTWKHGLRHTTKLAALDPIFVPTVQKLLREQARNVRDWQNGHQRLMDEQKMKRDNETIHRASLTFYALFEKTAPFRTPGQEATELDEYHKKVYRACGAMVESHTKQLKRLGVPFFGVKEALMLPDGYQRGSEQAESKKGTTGKITKKEVLELQQKMLNHLVEMYGD